MVFRFLSFDLPLPALSRPLHLLMGGCTATHVHTHTKKSTTGGPEDRVFFYRQYGNRRLPTRSAHRSLLSLSHMQPMKKFELGMKKARAAVSSASVPDRDAPMVVPPPADQTAIRYVAGTTTALSRPAHRRRLRIKVKSRLCCRALGIA